MQVYSGKSVFRGIAIGKISVYRKNEQQVKRVRTEDTKGELARYEAAKAAAIEQLQELYQKALKEVGEANAAIFEIHQMMLDDGDYNESVENIIETQKVNAEYAVAVTGDNFAQMFRAMDDDYMRERAADVKDISERVLSILNGGQKGKGVTDEPVIIVADDLAPSETVQLEKDMVLSFVTVHGSVNSHTAILARTMAIPALIGTEELPLDDTVDGKLAVVDGLNGKIYVEPDAQTLEEMKKRRQAELEKTELLQLLKGKENVTLDGKKIMLYANIGNIKDLATVIQNDAGGIGLFRSEFIYLEKDRYPTEEEQFSIYKTAVETMAGKRVIIRTLDIGADKQCEYFKMDKEENLPDPSGNLQNTASCAVPCERLRQSGNHVSDDHKPVGSETDQRDRGRSEGRTDRRAAGIRQSAAGYHDRDSCSGYDERETGKRGGFLQYRNQ